MDKDSVVQLIRFLKFNNKSNYIFPCIKMKQNKLKEGNQELSYKQKMIDNTRSRKDSQ